MAKPETDRKTITDRLKAEGWTNQGGSKHDLYTHPTKGVTTVPRHRTLTPRTARSIGKAAGWL